MSQIELCEKMHQFLIKHDVKNILCVKSTQYSTNRKSYVVDVIVYGGYIPYTLPKEIHINKTCLVDEVQFEEFCKIKNPIVWLN